MSIWQRPAHACRKKLWTSRAMSSQPSKKSPMHCHRQCSVLRLSQTHVQVGTATWPFAYEAAIGAGTLATTAAIFYQRPTLKSARMLFRFSIAFLPAFMLGLVIHRVPNHHAVKFSTIQEDLLQRLSLQEGEEARINRNMEGQTRDYPAVPIPFLPTPLQYRCPSKIACEGSESTSEGQAHAKNQTQRQ